MDQLYYELVHNLVVETTRTGIEVKNLKMQVESISSRLEFNERRARALESAVVYKTAEADEAPPPRPVPQPPPQRQPPPRQQQSRYTPPQPTYVAPVQVPPPAQTPSPTVVAVPEQQATGQGQPPASGQGVPGEGPGQRSRRRRRRRGRRGGGAAAAVMGAAGVSVPGATPDERPSGDAVDQMDALDAMDDDGSPEAEETHEAAGERVEPTAETVTRPAESHAAAPAVEPVPVEPVPVEPAGGESARVNHEPAAAPRVESPAPPHVDAIPAAQDAAPEPAPVPPATPDGADHDPQ
jgi:hypothetical protein